MTKSFPYNLVVSKSSEAIERLLFTDERFDSGTSGRTRRRTLNSLDNLGTNSRGKKYVDDLIVTPFDNDEFISFETEIPGGGGVKFTTLRMRETSRILERFIIPATGVDDIIASNFRKKVKNLKLINSDLLDAMRRIRPRYYISFGLGDDVSTWAGPFIVDLIDANISITQDGLREIELGFTPTLESIKIFTNKVFQDKDAGQGRTTFDGTTSQAERLRIETSKLYRVEPNNGDFPQQLANDLNEDGDLWNFAIRDLLKTYLSDRFTTVPDGNVLVLFPQDLDQTGSGAPIHVEGAGDKAFSRSRDIISIYRTVLASYGIFIGSTYEPIDREDIPDARKTDITLNILIERENKKIREAQRRSDPKRLNTGETLLPKNEADGIIRGAQRQIKLYEEETEIAKGIELRGGTPFRSRDLRSLYRRNQARLDRQQQTTNPDRAQATDIPESIEQVLLGIIHEVNPNDVDDSTLEFLRPLYTFFRTLRSKTSQAMDLTIFEENDLRTTKLLETYGLIEDGTAPVIVLGESSLITPLMYEEGNDLPSNIGKAFSIAQSPSGYSEKWSNFKKDLTRDTKDRRGRFGLTSSFNEKIDFGPYANFEQKLDPDTIVLMHNLKNSNVLEVNVDSSPYKGELFSMASESTYELLDEAVSESQEVIDNTFKFDAADYVVETYTPSGLGVTSTPQEIFDVLKTDKVFLRKIKDDAVVSGISVKDFLDLVRFKFKLDDTSFSISKDVAKGRVAQSDADIIRKINNYVFQVQVRTLPFFNTSYYLNRKCLLVGVGNKIVGSTFLREGENLPPPSIFSNAYRIFGYKHVITTTDAYSQFNLYQDGYAPSTNMDMTLGEYFEKELKDIPESVRFQEINREPQGLMLG